MQLFLLLLLLASVSCSQKEFDKYEQQRKGEKLGKKDDADGEDGERGENGEHEDPHEHKCVNCLPCDQTYCAMGKYSTGCVKSVTFSSRCGKYHHRYLPMSVALREEVLLQVNLLRSYVASGDYNTTMAARMPTMMWDARLAEAARVLIHLCSPNTLCSNTEKFKYVATMEISGVVPHLRDVPKQLIKLLVSVWLNDILGCRVNATTVGPIPPGLCTGHYIPLIQDHGNRMGCAMRYDKVFSSEVIAGTQPQNRLVFICNLSRAHVNEMPYYAEGKTPGEACKVGRHPFYEFLCDANEPVDNNFVKRHRPYLS